jgi:3-deoxy-manno-octulosonate cytidylyltransferase (CMP-KDO synthetase)
MHLKAIGIIPARYASTRFPGKPLAMINGKPMIQHVYERASLANFTAVVVATDDQRIKEAVEGFGGRVSMTSPDHETGTERCAEAFRTSGSDAQVVLNIQGDEPMVNPNHLDNLIDCFKDDFVDVATLISEMDSSQISDLNTVKAVQANDGRVMYFSRSPIPHDRDGKSQIKPLKHLGVYAYRASVLERLIELPPSHLERIESLEQLRWLENGYSIQGVTVEDKGISVDTPQDLENLLALWKD